MAIKKINTDLQIEAGLLDGDGNSGTSNQILISTGTGIDWVDGSGSGIIGGPYLPLTGGTMTGNLTLSYAYPRINLYDTNNDSDYSIINNDGSFSIYDVTNNSHRLSIASGGNATFAGSIKINNGTDPGSQLALFADSNGHTSLAGYTFEINTGNNNSRTRSFYIDNSKNATFAGTIAVQGTGDSYFQGNVGIGTTSPGEKLEIIGGGESDAVEIRLGTNTSSYRVTSIGQNDGNGAFEFGSYLDTYIVNRWTVNDNGDLILGTNNQEQMRISHSGNVGIGTDSPSEKLNVSGNILATGAIKGSSLYTNNVDQNNASRYGNLRSEVGFSRSPISGNPEQWFKVVELNGSPKRIKFSIIATGDNTNSYDNFLISTSGYGMNMHIQKLPGGKYNTSKLLSVAAINPDNGGGVEIWIKLGPVYSGTGATYVACTSDVLASATILTSATTTAPTITGNDTQLNISNDNRNYATIQTSRGATFGDKVGIGTTSPTQKLEVVGNIRAKGDDPKIYVTSTAINGRDYSIQSSQFGTFGIYDGTTSRLSIKSDGNVGIGTTSPSAKLDIYGDSNSADNMIELINSKYDSTDTAGETGILFGWNNHVAARITAFKEGTVNRTGFKIIGEAGFNVPTTIATFRSTGNVGIGVINPSRRLQVDSAAGYPLSLNSTQQYLMEFARNGVSEWWFAVNNGDFKFHENGVGDQVTIKAGGNVGIGTTSPSRALHVSDISDAPFRVESTDSTTGIQFKDPDGNNNIYYVGNGDYFYTTANVGIGTTSPGYKLDVNGSFRGGGIVADPGPMIFTYNEQPVLYGYIGFGAVPAAALAGVGDSGINSEFPASEAIRIASGGNVGIGTTSPGQKLDVAGNIECNSLYLNNGSSTYFVPTYYGTRIKANCAGLLVQNGSTYQAVYASAFSVQSDYRLKSNVVPLDNAIDRLKQMSVHRFNWNDRLDEPKVDGFIAHELSEVIPEAVLGEKDATKEDGTPDYQGIDQSKIVPLLTAALQDAITKIEQLETRIQTLENYD